MNSVTKINILKLGVIQKLHYINKTAQYSKTGKLKTMTSSYLNYVKNFIQ